MESSWRDSSQRAPLTVSASATGGSNGSLTANSAATEVMVVIVVRITMPSHQEIPYHKGISGLFDPHQAFTVNDAYKCIKHEQEKIS